MIVLHSAQDNARMHFKEEDKNNKMEKQEIPCKCPNCFSPDHIRTIRDETLDNLFWRDPKVTISVKCLQCSEVLHTFEIDNS